MSDGAKMGGGWLRHFSEGKWPLFLPILFFAPTLFMGLSADDLFHKAIIQGDFEPFVGKNEPILDLFSFFPQDPRVQALIQDWGLAPWWTVEGIHASFFRPVTAMTHLLDYALWPELPIMHHLHSLLWFVLAAWAVRRLFRTTGLTSVALGLAVFFFLVEDAHAMPVIWIANRNIMIAAFFGALAIEAYIKWRRAEGPLYQVLLFMVMGLLAAEAGLCAFGYMLAWSLVYETDWQRKVTATLPIIVLVITWRVVYNAMGYGEWGTGIYNDPVSDPVDFFFVFLERFPTLILGLWAQFPSDLMTVAPFVVTVIVAITGVILCVFLYRQFRSLLNENPSAQFWCLGMLFAVIPVCATLCMNRVLFFPGIGAFALLGIYLSGLEKPTRHFWFVVHGPIAIALCLGGNFGFKVFTDSFHLPPESNPVDLRADDEIIYLAGVALPAGYAIMKPLTEGRVYPRALEVLAHGTQDNTVKRLDDRTLSITARNGWFNLPMERMFRSSRTPMGGQRVFKTPRFTATVIKRTDDDRPKTVHFRFKRPLEHPRYRWMCFKPMKLWECKPPKIGESAKLEGMFPW